MRRTGHRAIVAHNGGSLKAENQGQSWDIHLFLEYPRVFYSIMLGKF